MVRKKRPVITGNDPAYTSDFARMRELPTVQPPVKAPVPAKARPKPVPKKGKPKPKQPPKAPTGPIAPATLKKREISITAAILVDHEVKLKKLAQAGVSPKDAIALAGRRAVERFQPSAKFVPKPDVNRMPMREGYKSTKRVAVELLDKLRDEHDPLRLQSDAAMVRGQFEPLFWQCLEEVIKELGERFG